MSQGQGGDTSENVDRATGTRRRRRFFRRPIEEKNPSNVEFICERQVAAVIAAREEQEQARQEQARQEQARQCYALFRWKNVTDESVEDDNQVAPNDHPEHSSSSANTSNELKQQETNSISDFLEGTFFKISSDKQKSARNKKNSKNNKKKKGKSRKQPRASEMQTGLCTEPSSSTSVNAGASGESLPFSSSYVAIDVPLLEYSSSSSSSPVTELITPVSNVSSGNEKELSSNSNDSRSIGTSYYSVASSPVNDSSSGSNASVTNDSYTGSNAWNNSMGDDAGSLSDVRNERKWSSTGLTDYRGFNKWGGDRNQPSDHKSFSVAISSTDSSSQESSLCGENPSPDGEFQKVISRKTAQKLKKAQRVENPIPSPTMASSLLPISGALVPRAPREITLGHYIKDDCFSGRKQNHKKGKNQKGRSLDGVPKTGCTDDEKNDSGQSGMLNITVHPGNLERSHQMELSSTSHHGVALEVIEEINCSSGCLPSQGELKDLAPADHGDDAKDTDSRETFSDKTSSPDHRARVDSSSVDCEEQKEEEDEQALSSHESELDKIVKAVNNACEIQAAAMTSVADIENFLLSATPIIGQQSIALSSVWGWYEEPESFGIEVEIQKSTKYRPSGTSWSKLCAYFVPSLSAVQLFGQSPNDGGLLFDYFERENPFVRPPLFTKIKQLVSGENRSGNPMFGDPKQLESVKLSELHPASWFCVAWYPIYQIPSAPGSCKASFLTYHSLGKLVPKTCSTNVAEGLTHINFPIVGLLCYKCQGEKWFQPGEQPESSKPTSGGSLETDPAQLLNQRLKALRHSASAMSTAVVPRATGKAIMNYHPDYGFFSQAV